MKLFSAEGPVFSGLIKLFDCICLSVLWFVCCLPVITIGVSCTALYTTVYKYIRREEGTLTATFSAPCGKTSAVPRWQDWWKWLCWR